MLIQRANPPHQIIGSVIKNCLLHCVLSTGPSVIGSENKESKCLTLSFHKFLVLSMFVLDVLRVPTYLLNLA
jgi:hypothetical protein